MGQSLSPEAQHRRRRGPRVAVAIVLVVVVAAGMAVIVAFPVPRFPAPTGPFQIGTRSYDWVDVSRPEPFTPDPVDQRHLVAQVWYPADPEPGATTTPYWPDRATRDAVAQNLRLPAFLLDKAATAPTHAVADAPPAAGRFPVLVFVTGISGYRDSSLFWIEELVSHGYLVVGVDQPGIAAATTLPDGRVIPMMQRQDFDTHMPLAVRHHPRQTTEMNGVTLPGGIIPFLAQDVRFALNQLGEIDRHDAALAGHLDVQRAGVFGVSLGGYIGPEAARQDARFHAVVVADAGQSLAVARRGIDQPVMIMTRDADVMRQERAQAGGWAEPDIDHAIRDQRDLYAKSRSDAYFLTQNTMFHINWTDLPVLSPLVTATGLSGPIDPERGHAMVNAYTVAFFDSYLKGKPGPLLTGASSDWPETSFEHRVGR
jgi:predicted dienelactone hydrolase